MALAFLAALAISAGAQAIKPAPVAPPPASVAGQPLPPNHSQAAASPEEKRLQELLKLQFDRRPAAVLQALARQAEADPALTNQVQRFQIDVVAGNWKAVKAYLAKLPAPHGLQVYRHLLQQLQQVHGPSPPPQPSGPQPAPAPQPQGVMPVDPVLLPDDVLALADAAPGELSEDLINLLGALLSRALNKGHSIEPFVAQLEMGSEHLGGTDPQKRRSAASLLIASNRLPEAAEFLPPLQQALEKQEAATVAVHSRLLIATAKQPDQTNAAAGLRRAWDLTQAVVSWTNSPEKERKESLLRALELIPLLTQGLGANWLRESFQKNPDQAVIILASVGNLVAQNFANRDTQIRRTYLELQKRTVDALLEVIDLNNKIWEAPLNALALGWLQEADYSKMRYLPQRPLIYPQHDMYGNRYYSGQYGPGQDPNQLPPVAIDQLLAAAPNERWIQQLDESLGPRVLVTLAELHLKIEEEAHALNLIERLAPNHPKLALDLASELLRSWARNRDPQQQQGPYYGPRYYGPYGYMQPQGIPLTRAMQARNVRQLADLVRRLNQLPIGPLQDTVLAGAFSSSHSPAEVFLVEDIERVFGPVDKIKLETLSEILQTMRQRLAGQWRQPRVQQEAQTKRTDKEIDAEVARGYELVIQLIANGLEKEPDNWRMNLVQGAALFDWAEFDYGKKVDLAVYIEKRDGAFGAFEKAARLYAQAVPSLSDNYQTSQVYLQWFNAALGASDLAYLTRQTEPDTNHLDKIRFAIRALPSDAPERHLESFGKTLTESINSLRPELKPRYLRAALPIIGDHQSAAEARKLVTYYDDLLDEIALDVRVDGETTVGHIRPFGVFVGIRHSEAVGRESGGFAKYLRNQQNQPYFYNPYGQQPVNYRDDFEKQVREKLIDGFDILSVTFHEEKVQPRGFGKPNWRETPYAYLLLKAKDASVDRIPSLQLDLDFLDRRGQVVLPVISQVQWIDARPENAPPRPMSKINLLQILDERDLDKGKLTLEIKATAHGLLRELKDLVDLSLAGLKIDKITDPGLTIAKMDTEYDEVAPISERSWLIEMSLDPTQESLGRFRFPQPKTETAEIAYKRYADADLVEVKPELALAGLMLRPKPVWPWIMLGAFLLAALGIAIRLRRHPKTAPIAERTAYAIPGHITPFSVLSLLQRMQTDLQLALTEEQRRELSQTIQSLQDHYFGRSQIRPLSPDLRQIAEQWVYSINGNHSPIRRL